MKEDEMEIKIGQEIQDKYQELKNKSKTYGCLVREINTFCRAVIFRNCELGNAVMNEMQELLKKDIDKTTIQYHEKEM